MSSEIPDLNSLRVLGGNLREAISVDFDQDSLIANYWGTRLYGSSNIMGRFWTWIYRILDAVSSVPCDRQRCLLSAIDKTNRTFQENLTSIRTYYSLYIAYLKLPQQGNTVTRADLGRLRRGITRWNHAIHPLLDVRKETNFAIGHRLQPILKKLAFMQQIINEAARFPSPISIDLIGRLSQGQPIDSKQWEQLETWITEINDNPRAVTSGQLHQYLSGIVGLFEPNSNLAFLESTLEQRGLSLVTQPDPDDEKWKRTLQKGQVVSIGTNTYTLGNPVNPKKDDHRLVFTIHGNEEHVVVVSAFPADLGIHQNEQTDNCVAKVQALDSTGRMGLMEKCIPWEEITLTDGDITRVVGFIREQLERNQTYTRLITRSWMLTPDRSALRCTKVPSHTGSFFPLDLRDFALHVAQGDQTLYRKLVIDSGLSADAYHHYYSELIEEALKEEPNGDLVNLHYPGLNSQLDLSAAEFMVQVSEYYSHLQSALSQYSNHPRYKDILLEEMKRAYHESHGLGRFFDGYADKVRAAATAKLTSEN